MRNSLKLLFAFFWSRQASRIYCMKPGVSEKCNKSALVHVTRDIYIYIYIYIYTYKLSSVTRDLCTGIVAIYAIYISHV